MKTLISGLRLALQSAALLLAFTQSGSAQTYPSRPVTLVVPSNAGASSDQFARQFGQMLAKQTSASAVVENKPGANGIIGVQSVLNAPADGYTVLVTTISPIIFNKYLYKSLPYDPQKDLVPVAIYAQSAMMLGANPQLASKDLRSLVSFAKDHPGKLNFGYATSTQQLAGEMFQLKSGTKLTFVPYRTNAAMLTALISGELDLAISDPAGFLPFIKTNQIRLLSTTAAKRLPTYPDVPTFVENKVDFSLATWNGMFVKPGTPPEVAGLLSRVLQSTLEAAETQSYIKTNSYDNFLITGKAAADRVNSDLATWKVLTEAAGVVPQQ
jgi:tripartite-type tricarboxylate transporter receptor subunit TctC